jgi:hypothetical protein
MFSVHKLYQIIYSRIIGTNAPLYGGGPLSSNQTISITKADSTTDGYLSSTDWNTFNNKGSIGSVGLNTGNSGTDINVSGSPLTSSGSITLNIPTASNTNTGKLSSTDWNTFNNKQAALVSGTNIKTVNSTSLLGSGDVAVQATLVSGTNIKTVNSTSLLGSGDITTPVGIHAARIPASGGFINALMIVYQATTTTTQSANTLRCFPFIPMKTFTIVSYSIEVTTAVAASNMRVLFYDSLNGLPNAKLHESANIDSSTIGVKTVTQAYTFNAGTTYWLCYQSSAAVSIKTHTATGGAFAWQQTGAGAQLVNNVGYTYAIGSAPATLTTTGASYATVAIPHLIFNL